MKEKIYFKGLTTEEFSHPKELSLKKTLLSSQGYKKISEMLSNMVTTFMFTMKVGVYTKLSAETAPELFEIVEDVCRILDVDKVPELYLWHSYSCDILPCGGSSEPYLVISDYVVENLDTGMLYYLFGNAIAMIKAGHVEITNIASCLTANIWLTAPQMAIKEFLHVADATSDRGGLLSCQSIAAAVRCHFVELGLPISEVKRMFSNDEDTVEYVRDYLSLVNSRNRKDTQVTIIAEKWKNLNYIEAPANDMLAELYEWYCKGYQQLLQKYSERQGEMT